MKQREWTVDYIAWSLRHSKVDSRPSKLHYDSSSFPKRSWGSFSFDRCDNWDMQFEKFLERRSLKGLHYFDCVGERLNNQPTISTPHQLHPNLSHSLILLFNILSGSSINGFSSVSLSYRLEIFRVYDSWRVSPSISHQQTFIIHLTFRYILSDTD